MIYKKYRFNVKFSTIAVFTMSVNKKKKLGSRVDVGRVLDNNSNRGFFFFNERFKNLKFKNFIINNDR
jgi:hypothetical protein